MTAPVGIYKVKAVLDKNAPQYTPESLCKFYENPYRPAQIRFGYLLGERFYPLKDRGNDSTLDIARGSGHTDGLRVIGLVTCAAVIFWNVQSKKGYASHSNTGLLTDQNVQTALDQIQSRSKDSLQHVRVIFAHALPSDPGYDESLTVIQKAQIATEHIVDISDVIGTFAITASGRLGF